MPPFGGKHWRRKAFAVWKQSWIEIKDRELGTNFAGLVVQHEDFGSHPGAEASGRHGYIGVLWLVHTWA